MFQLFLLITVLPALALATLNVDSCSGSTFPLSVEVEGCEASPCTMTRGTERNTKVRMVIPRGTTTIEPKLTARVGLIDVNYELSEEIKKGCNFLTEGGPCPVEAEDIVEYILKQEVDKASPSGLSVLLTFNILDDQRKNIACWKWTAKIV